MNKLNIIGYTFLNTFFKGNFFQNMLSCIFEKFYGHKLAIVRLTAPRYSGLPKGTQQQSGNLS